MAVRPIPTPQSEERHHLTRITTAATTATRELRLPITDEIEAST